MKSEAFKEGVKRFRAGKDPLNYSKYLIDDPRYVEFKKGWDSVYVHHVEIKDPPKLSWPCHEGKSCICDKKETD
jgi:hypothetical protein